jgi:hypothetical protein
MNSITDAFKSEGKLIVIHNDLNNSIITIYKDGSDDKFEFNYSEVKILIEKLNKVMGIEEEPSKMIDSLKRMGKTKKEQLELNKPAMDWATKRMEELKNKTEDEIDELQEQTEMYSSNAFAADIISHSISDSSDCGDGHCG